MKKSGVLGMGMAAAAGMILLSACESAKTPPPEPPASTEPAPVPTPPPAELVSLTVTSRVLNLREEPSPKAAALGQLKKGDKVGLLEERGAWARVKLPDSHVGWVDARYVRKGSEPCLPDRSVAILVEPPFRMDTRGPHGRVVVEGDVDTGGKVGKTRVISNETGSAEIAASAEAELKQMKFLSPVKNCKVRPFVYTYARSY
jgi:hypothetical protein